MQVDHSNAIFDTGKRIDAYEATMKKFSNDQKGMQTSIGDISENVKGLASEVAGNKASISTLTDN